MQRLPTQRVPCWEETHEEELGQRKFVGKAADANNDSCGVRTHALADWRLEPAP